MSARALGIGAVYVYRNTLGLVLAAVAPAPGGRCKYYPSCSRYSIDAFARYGLLRGVVLSGWRLLRCNPWSHGGVDRAEDQRLFRRVS